MQTLIIHRILRLLIRVYFVCSVGSCLSVLIPYYVINNQMLTYANEVPEITEPQRQKMSLRKHAYSNILKILPPKNENVQIKHSDSSIFLFKTYIMGTR